MQLDHMKIKSNMVIASFSAVGDVFFCSEVEIGMIPENPIAKVKKITVRNSSVERQRYHDMTFTNFCLSPCIMNMSCSPLLTVIRITLHLHDPREQ
jgi:hypothetical protein